MAQRCFHHILSAKVSCMAGLESRGSRVYPLVQELQNCTAGSMDKERGRIVAIFIVLPYRASESQGKRRAWNEDSDPCLSHSLPSSVPILLDRPWHCQLALSSAGFEVFLPVSDCPLSDLPSTLHCRTGHPLAHLSGCPCFAQKLSVPQVTHSTSLDSSLWLLHIHHLATSFPARLSLFPLFQPCWSHYHFSGGYFMLLTPSPLGNPSHSEGPTGIFPSPQYGLPAYSCHLESALP